MTKQQKRDKVAEDMLWHLTNVMAFEENVPGSLRMQDYVTELDENECGTVCCMAGWLPATFPSTYAWMKNGFGGSYPALKRSRRVAIDNFPGLKKDLAEALYGTDSGLARSMFGIGLSTGSDTKQVRKVWNKAIEMVRNGKLDEHLRWK